jgi:hypothetical protein
MQSSVAAEPVRKQLDRILSSAAFVRNERLSRFLRFVVQQALDGKTDEIKESLLGIEVFGRAPSYDTRSDSVVRTEAADQYGGGVSKPRSVNARCMVAGGSSAAMAAAGCPSARPDARPFLPPAGL